MRTISLEKIDFSYYFNFLFLFFAILDPTRKIFHLTEVALFICLLVNFKKFNYSFIFPIIFVLAVYFVSLGFMERYQPVEKARQISLLTSNIFLFYLLLSKADSNKTFLCFYKVGLIMSVIVVAIGILYFTFNKVSYIFINFFVHKKGTMMFTSAKKFLNLVLICIFYKTSPMIVLLFPFSLLKFLEEKNKKYLLHSALFFGNLFLSGTRANVLSAILLIGLVFLFNLWNNKKSFFLFPTLLIEGFFAAALLIFLIISMKDHSSSVKDLHRISEWELFLKNPVRTFFVGYGPGSMFFTKGWNSMTSQTELSYLELIRNYGLLGAIGVISIFFFPILLMLKNSNYPVIYRLSLGLGYIAYLFIAGTNPFLNCATGYLTMSIFYYMSCNNILEEMDECYG